MAHPVNSAAGIQIQFRVSTSRHFSPLNPFPACSSHEEIGKAIESYHSRKLISSCLTHCCQTPKPRHGLAACPLPPLRGTTSHARAWPGWHPQSLCQSRHQTGRVWEEEFAADCSAIQVSICVNWVIYGCLFFLHCKGDAQDLWK